MFDGGPDHQAGRAADTIAGVAPLGLSVRRPTVELRLLRSRLPLILLVLFCAAATVGCASAPAPGKSAGGFDRYPHSPPLDAIVKAHKEGEADREQWIVLTTWFRDGDPRVAMMSGVQPDGRVSIWRYVHEYAVQNSPASSLVADELADLRPLLVSMPPSQSPTLANLLIVSVRQEGRWTTHTYDRAGPPEQLVRLFALTRAPIEAGKLD